MEEFFSHENQAVPPSLSRDGGLYIGIKSQLMDILESNPPVKFHESLHPLMHSS